MSYNFTELPSIETERLILRRMTMDDAQHLFDFTSNPIGKEYLSWDAHKTIEQTYGFLAMMEGRRVNNEPVQWGIELKSEKRIIGIIGLAIYMPAHNRGEFTYILSPDYLGKGYMTEAAAAFFRFCFEEIKLNRLEGKNEEDHIDTHKIIEKLGMRREGVLRDLLFQKGKYRNYIMWSILAKEYYEKRENEKNSPEKYYKVVINPA